MSKYRVHVHDHADQGRWLAQADFARRPTQEQVTAAFPVLSQPGRYEVRLGLLSGEDEINAGGWLQGEFVQDPANPTDAELAAAIQRGLADGSLIDAEAWLADHECCGDCTPGFTVADRMAELDAQIAEPVITEGMTRDEGRAELDRYLADHRAQDDRLDEEHLLLGIGRSAAVCMTHEITGSWITATASRWWQALPERYMTPDSLAYPDWDHSHYPHDEHGHIGRVTTRQRPLTEEDIRQRDMVAAILADDNC